MPREDGIGVVALQAKAMDARRSGQANERFEKRGRCFVNPRIN